MECICKHGGGLYKKVLRLTFVCLPSLNFVFKGPRLSSSCSSLPDTPFLLYLWSTQERKTCPGKHHHSNTAGGNMEQEGARKRGWKPFFPLWHFLSYKFSLKDWATIKRSACAWHPMKWLQAWIWNSWDMWIWTARVSHLWSDLQKEEEVMTPSRNSQSRIYKRNTLYTNSFQKQDNMHRRYSADLMTCTLTKIVLIKSELFMNNCGHERAVTWFLIILMKSKVNWYL